MTDISLIEKSNNESPWKMLIALLLIGVYCIFWGKNLILLNGINRETLTRIFTSMLFFNISTFFFTLYCKSLSDLESLYSSSGPRHYYRLLRRFRK